MAKGKSYYKVKTDVRAPKALKVLKFNSDLDLESEYFMTYFEGANKGYYDCSCPASKFDCRHKRIKQAVEDAGQIDGDKFFCYETEKFVSLEEIG